MSTQQIGTPTYYVRHPDGSISIAEPQPTPEQIAAQDDIRYAQCNRQHGGSVCSDPDCHLMPLVRVRDAAPELLKALQLMLRGTQEDCGRIFMPSDEAVRAAFAAIAKATAIPAPGAAQGEHE